MAQMFDMAAFIQSWGKEIWNCECPTNWVLSISKNFGPLRRLYGRNK